MPIPATPRRAGPFLGDGVATDFPFGFRVFEDTDVIPRVLDAEDQEFPVVRGADYNVVLNPDQENNPGGNVVFTSPLPSGYRVSVIGSVPYNQDTAFPSGGRYRADIIERVADRLAMQVQQLEEQNVRALRINAVFEADPNVSLELPPPAPNTLLGWDSAGLALTGFDRTEFLAAAQATVDSASAAASSASAASTSASNAAASASNAAASATNAAASASAADTSASNAANSATSAANSASSASTSATNAANSATSAANSASSASTSASSASGSASSASSSATNAASSATAAAGSAASALSHLNAFRGQYYGALSSDPALDPNGNTPTAGDFYFRTADNVWRVRRTDGSWQTASNLAQLGTAAALDAQTSTTDTTANRLMRVGAFGWGTSVGGLSPSAVADLDSPPFSGVFQINPDTLNRPTDWGTCLHMYRTSSGTAHAFQIAKGNDASGNLFWRSVDGAGTWGAWRNLYHTGNLTQVSQADAEAGTSTTNRLWSAERVRQAISYVVGGAAGAPRVLSDTAINWNGFGVGANAARNYMLARMATLSVGVVGSLAFLAPTTRVHISPGGTRAGSGLGYASVRVDNDNNSTPLISIGTSPPGTWRLLGHIVAGPQSSMRSASVWLRIS